MRHLSAYLLLVLGGNEKPTVGIDWDMFDGVGCWHQERPWDCWRWGWGWEDWEADRWSGGKERRGADQGGTWEACLHSYWRCCPRCWCCSCCCWGEEGGGEEGRGGRRGGHWYVWRWSFRWWWRRLVNDQRLSTLILINTMLLKETDYSDTRVWTSLTIVGYFEKGTTITNRDWWMASESVSSPNWATSKLKDNAAY